MARKGVIIGYFRFAPSVLMTLLTVLLVVLFVRLGLWQQQRAAEKQAILELHALRATEPPLRLEAGMTGLDDFVHRRLIVEGVYDVRHQVLLDNQVFNRVAGYHVLTPLILEGGTAVLVNRGWLPVGKSRKQLPELPLPASRLKLTGRASAPPGTIFQLSPGEAYTAGWPKVAQHVRPEEIAVMLHYPLLPYIVLLDDDQDHGFARDWKIVAVHPGKHSSYAMQWFGLAALVLLIYVFMNTRQVSLNEKGATQE